MLPNPSDTFLQEADELLGVIEAAALTISAESADKEAINQIFRAFHTIKGSGAMFGFQQVAEFTHHVENLLDLVREGLVPASDQLSTIILSAIDEIRLLLNAAQSGTSPDATSQSALLQQVHELIANAGHPQSAAVMTAHAGRPVSGLSAETISKVWHIRFRPESGLLTSGGNPVLLFRDLKKLGSCVIEGHSDCLPALEDLQPEACHLWWTISLTTAAPLSEIRDVFLFVEEGSELDIEAAAEAAPPDSAAPQQAVLQPEASAPVSPNVPVAVKESVVRVPSSKLDRLVNLVGELVMNRSRLISAVSRYHAPELVAPVEEIERLVSELRDDVLAIRMMPIGSIFGRFRRLVHDLSSQLGKEVQLITEGEDTELDKSILDQLGEPLVHLIRNSVDHGIEAGPDRLAKGKGKLGTIRLTAVHRGSDVVVRIEDDGAGLDRAAIYAKALAKQLIAADANLSDKEILNLILLPGFSTARSVTSISGRGVGMDVVKRQIDALRGSLVVSSEPGHGTCVSLTLPLTLAIIDGLLVEVDDSQFIIPMAVVTENVELPRSERCVTTAAT